MRNPKVSPGKTGGLFRKFAGLALSAAMAAILTACPDNVTTVVVSPEPASLLSVSVGGFRANRIPAPIPVEDWNNPDFNLATLPANIYTGIIAIGEAGSFAVNATASEGAGLEYGVADGAGARPSFRAENTVGLDIGNFLYIRVRSGNGIVINTYRFLVTDEPEEDDANLVGVTIGGVSAFDLGSGFPTLAATVAGRGGRILLQNDERMELFYAVATAAHPRATVNLGQGRGTEVPSFYTHNNAELDFNDGDFLYVRVIAVNGDILFHKIEVRLRQVTTVVYGTPQIGNGLVDPIWTGLPALPLNINRIYQGYSQPGFPDTSGVARVLWDSDGLYVYVRVADPNVTSASGNAHERDSVELFVNEAVDAIPPPGNWGSGSMYRVGANGDRSAAPAAAANAFRVSDAWTTDDGYVVMFHAPWRHGTPAAGDRIGLDLRINACTGSQRDGVLAWNNLAHSNYANMANLGLGILMAEGEGPVTEIVVYDPVFLVGHGATRNPDGSVNMVAIGGNALAGLDFNSGEFAGWNRFSSVTFYLTFTNRGTGNMGIQIKNANMDFSPDIANPSVDRFPAQSGIPFTFTRPTSAFGSNAVTFQMATWGGRSQDWLLTVQRIRFHD